MLYQVEDTDHDRLKAYVKRLVEHRDIYAERYTRSPALVEYLLDENNSFICFVVYGR
jgi:hypothetical protein